MHRRTFLAGSAATAAICPATRSTASMTIGAGTLDTVSDGHLVLPGSFLFDPMPQDTLPPIIEAYNLDRDRLTPECNLALYRDGDRVVLFDAGAGPDFMPTAGKVADNLGALGVAPEDVTDVIFTHAHPDHIWGLLDEFDEPLFPNASYQMGRTEWDYWWDPETVDTIETARQAFAVGARRRMEVIADKVVLFGDGEEVLPGIAAVASFGHTPGHMSFEIRQGSNAALLVGDAINNHHVAFVQPEWPSGSDQDPKAAIATRTRLLDRLAHEKMQLVGFHLPQGGIGRVDRTGGAYRFVPQTE